MIIREAGPGDAAAVAAIYGHHVLTSLATFEEIPPSEAEMAARIAAVRSHGLPYLVAENDGGRVTGFAYAAPFRPRAAYRYTAEDSVYIDPAHVGRGVGRALLGEVVAVCEGLGLRQLMAVIGDSGNAASIGLHRALGFQESGVGRGLGFKQGRWVDIVNMQRPLGAGHAAAPDGRGLELQ
ncbi:MAG TPA: GNAT family N-acetyltransferase [Caulobacteraceae bacterium]